MSCRLAIAATLTLVLILLAWFLVPAGKQAPAPAYPVDRLRVGMTPAEALAVLGEPTGRAFGRWDYIEREADDGAVLFWRDQAAPRLDGWVEYRSGIAVGTPDAGPIEPVGRGVWP